MSSKTYIPGAVLIAGTCHRYMTRWTAQLSAGMTSTQLAALSALISCLADFLAKVTKPPPTP